MKHKKKKIAGILAAAASAGVWLGLGGGNPQPELHIEPIRANVIYANPVLSQPIKVASISNIGINSNGITITNEKAQTQSADIVQSNPQTASHPQVVVPTVTTVTTHAIKTPKLKSLSPMLLKMMWTTGQQQKVYDILGLPSEPLQNVQQLPRWFVGLNAVSTNTSWEVGAVNTTASNDTKVQVVGFTHWSNPSIAQYVIDHPYTKFVILADVTAMQPKYLEAMGKPNVIGVIIGQYITEHPKHYAQWIPLIKAERAVYSRATHAPMLLACSAVAWPSYAAKDIWTKHFDLTKWQGAAIVNVLNFTSFAGKNLRQMQDKAGIPHGTPTIVLDLVGYVAHAGKRAKLIERYKAKPFMRRLRRQGYRGVLWLGHDVKNSTVKESLITGLEVQYVP